MPEVTIQIGGRSFQVACQQGEEAYLHAAAKLLDDEATVLVNQIGRIPESRLLLMAGLMLADKTAGLEDRLRAAEDRLAVQTAQPGAAAAPPDDRLRDAEARIAAQEAELEELRTRPEPADAEAAAERLQAAEARLAAQEAELEELRAASASAPAPAGATPDQVTEMLAALAARAEALADTVEAEAAADGAARIGPPEGA